MNQISNETREKISAARKLQIPPMLGKLHSDETKQKMSEVQKRTRHSPHTPESKAKMSIALTAAWARRRGYEYVNPKDQHLVRKFGIRYVEYQEKFTDQGGKCAICGEKEDGKDLSVDHDHKSGLVRGLLCQKCNTGLGLFMDNITVLKKAIEYLEK